MKKDPMSFSLDLFSCKGKVVMITGANTGLGMIYAIALAKAGADLFTGMLCDTLAKLSRMQGEPFL